MVAEAEDRGAEDAIETAGGGVSTFWRRVWLELPHSSSGREKRARLAWRGLRCAPAKGRWRRPGEPSRGRFRGREGVGDVGEELGSFLKCWLAKEGPEGVLGMGGSRGGGVLKPPPDSFGWCCGGIMTGACLPAGRACCSKVNPPRNR